MMVKWQLPDGTVRIQPVPDMEQLMFLLRMTGGIELEGCTYRVSQSILVAEPEGMSVTVKLAPI